MLVDTHCHLNHEQFANDVAGAVSRAHDAGVARMIVIGYDLDSSAAAVELAMTVPSLYAAVGIHPHDANHYTPETETKVRELAVCSKVVAIGEIGLDFHYDYSSIEDQIRALRAQLSIAAELHLPVVIHCRKAYDETLDELEDWARRGIQGVMHCWGGSAEQADRAVSMGLFLGFGGVMTFKNADQTRDIARSVPMDRILLETDSPYLAPVPYRGKRNEPAHTRVIAESFSAVRGLDVAEVARATTANAEKLFANPH